METRTHNLNFMCLRIEKMLRLINFQGVKDLSKKFKATFKNLKKALITPFFDANIFVLITYMTKGKKESDWGKI